MDESDLNYILKDRERSWIKRLCIDLRTIFCVGYLVIYNEQRLQAECVIERLTKTSVTNNIPTIKRNKFKFKNCVDIGKDNAGVPLHPTNTDFNNTSRYIRGHIAAAANHKSDENEYRATFSYINVLPEAKDLTALQKLEDEIRDLTHLYEEVFVISGPLHEDTGKGLMLLNGRIPIPTHLFKIIMCMKNGTMIKSTAYKIRNEPQTGICKKDIDTSKYEVDLEHLNQHLKNIEIFITATKNSNDTLLQQLLLRHPMTTKNHIETIRRHA